MSDEPTTTPINDDDNKPATKGDVRKAVEGLAEVNSQALNDVATKNELAAVANDVKENKATMKRVLEIVSSIDENTRGIPAKVDRLHEKVFPHG